MVLKLSKVMWPVFGSALMEMFFLTESPSHYAEKSPAFELKRSVYMFGHLIGSVMKKNGILGESHHHP